MADNDAQQPSDFDREVDKRFKLIDDVAVPDNWSRIVGDPPTEVDHSPSTPRRYARPLATAACLLAAVTMGGLLWPASETEVATEAPTTTLVAESEPTSTTTVPERSEESTPTDAADCGAAEAASLLASQAGPFDYQPSPDPNSLARGRVAVRGQLVMASGSTLLVKAFADTATTRPWGSAVGRLEVAGARFSNVELGGFFVAFVDPEIVDGTASLAVEGLWIACVDRFAAIPVFATDYAPGWDDFLASRGSLDDLWRIGQFPDGERRTTFAAELVENDASVFAVTLVTGERLRLRLPVSLGDEFTLTETAVRGALGLAGDNWSGSLLLGNCRHEDFDRSRLTANAQGALVASVGQDVLLCRPEDRLSMRLTVPAERAAETAAAIDLRVFDHGTELWRDEFDQPLLFGDVRFGDFGPNVLVKESDDGTIAAFDYDTLATRWTVDSEAPAPTLYSGRGVVHVVAGERLTTIDVVDGSVQWETRLAAGEGAPDVFQVIDDTLLIATSFDDDRAPQLQRIDAVSGAVLWTSEGRKGAKWEPLRWLDIVAGRILLVDDLDEGSPGVLAFDPDSGELLWSAELEQRSGTTDTGASSIANLEVQGVYVTTRYGDLFRINPGTGAILWRSEVEVLGVNGTDYGADGTTLGLGVDLIAETGLVDFRTGELLGITRHPAYDCPVTQPPQDGFVPPEPWPEQPNSDELVWFGSADLWTAINPDGHIPRKSVWWSANFPGGIEEEMPAIQVVYERLDLNNLPIVMESPGTNAFTAEDGWFMINGIEPTGWGGCWRATATYKGARLSYVYEGN